MSDSYYLVNYTKKQMICFMNLPASTIGEIMANPICSAMVVYYLNDNKGDDIQFVNDYDDDLTIYCYFAEMTHQIIDKMLKEDILMVKNPKQVWVDDEIWFYHLSIKNSLMGGLNLI